MILLVSQLMSIMVSKIEQFYISDRGLFVEIFFQESKRRHILSLKIWGLHDVFLRHDDLPNRTQLIDPGIREPTFFSTTLTWGRKHSEGTPTQIQVLLKQYFPGRRIGVAQPRRYNQNAIPHLSGNWVWTPTERRSHDQKFIPHSMFT